MVLARLNYITVNYPRHLALDNGFLSFGFRYGETGHAVRLSNVTESTHVWDVTNAWDITEMNTSRSGETTTFSPITDGHREYVAFNENASFPSPSLVGAVSNQDIHGEATPDFIIITHRPGTMEQCDSLFGVTMQKRGVSQMLKVKLVDAIEMAEPEEKAGAVA